jgi:hypothetical protein
MLGMQQSNNRYLISRCPVIGLAVIAWNQTDHGHAT